MSPCRYPWTPDNGDGTYSNPILHADYSDPDVIRVGDDFWMTASSFNCAPGLPILHSRDLVNWRLVNHAIRHVPHPSYSDVRIGGGVWAPAIRHHDGKFWIVFPMPDEGIYVTTAENPAGAWSEPWCLQESKGWIDPCLFWDDDGSAWLAHAYAFSRSGLKERIHLRPMSPDGRRLLGDAHELFHTPHHLYLEGPKVHKLDGWYYIMCPGGGVQTGWQVAFRSRSLFGPYEEKVVLEQGSTPVNGPHQGALVDAPDGSWWFVHFQDRGPFGRITHLQPVAWVDGWPLCGEVRDGICQPVASWRKPVAGHGPEMPATSDDFTAPVLGLQWQWQANHEDAWYSLEAGRLRLYPGPATEGGVSRYPRFLGQKFPAAGFRVTTTVDMSSATSTSTAGLAITSGADAHFIALRRADTGFELILGTPGGLAGTFLHPAAQATLSVEVAADGSFHFTDFPAHRFTAKEGGWIGSRVGLFHYGETNPQGHADFTGFHFAPPTAE